MTMPQTPAEQDGAVQAQVLMSLGKIEVQLAVINEKLNSIPDHEARLRRLERFRYMWVGLSSAGGVLSTLLGYLTGKGKI